jgi:cytochrome c-type biogenesis protein CcmH
VSNRRWLSWSITAALAVFVALSLIRSAPPDEDRARAIGERIRCPVCQGESIAESPADTARAMMDLVRERIAQGRSDGEIIDELVGSYGGSVLLDPPLRGPTLWLWLLPLAAVTAGAWLLAARFRTGTEAPLPAPARGYQRATVGGLILIGAAAVTLALLAEGRQSPGSGFETIDPESISNETLEAVIASNLDDPDIVGMRLALANRYFEAGDYRAAFPHYEAVIEGEPTPAQAASALTRLGWMVFDGNGEVEVALDLLDQALAAAPADPFATYLKARVLWCGRSDNQGAVALLNQVLGQASLDPEVRTRVAADLDAAGAGETCP